MKTRILTGVVAGGLFLAILVQPWTLAVNLVMALLAVIAVYELLYVTGYARHWELVVPSAVFAAAVPFLEPLFSQKAEGAIRFEWMPILLAAYAMLLCILAVIRHTRVNIQEVAYAVVLTVLSSFALASIAYLREMSLELAVLVLLIPWVSDTGAYFTGTFFGKHKLCPQISPKKTLEGLIGGIVLAVAVDVLVAWLWSGESISLWIVAAVALIGAPLSVFGDLFASIIKRQCGIKDYGHLFPGHGGVMDRFDSFLFVSFPAYLALLLLS